MCIRDRRWGDWVPSREVMSSMMGRVVRGIHDNRDNQTGYIMAFPYNESNYFENPDYVTSWVTHGLLEASLAGEALALPLLRAHFDWFDYDMEKLPQLLPPSGGPKTAWQRDSHGHSGWPAPIPWNTIQMSHGHQVYLILQGIIHHTRVALSPVGIARDVQVAAELYTERWWLEQLAARNLSAIWERHFYPHNYEVTALEAYLDLYVLTGDELFLNGVKGGWEMLRAHWLHPGGSFALNEAIPYPPDSFFLTRQATGETCGSVFWIKLNQRFQSLFPRESVKYTDEIERSIYNVLMANAAPEGSTMGNRYFTGMHKYLSLIHI
eukprot:TRINITY_DN4097_c0_g1_i2.p1 TRINITY_DN4097_c0_g1~~TRINITY_DN4097_c0_g1_i2.p1  ORF type:complete len:323 (-),score=64.03 TRINITY_DN4097_c0_g1_i2:122-1090(-)